MTPETTPLETIQEAIRRVTNTVGDGTLQHGRIAQELEDIHHAAKDLDQENERLTELLLEAQADAGWTTDNEGNT